VVSGLYSQNVSVRGLIGCRFRKESEHSSTVGEVSSVATNQFINDSSTERSDSRSVMLVVEYSVSRGDMPVSDSNGVRSRNTLWLYLTRSHEQFERK
jgi:hypothetical protein